MYVMMMMTYNNATKKVHPFFDAPGFLPVNALELLLPPIEKNNLCTTCSASLLIPCFEELVYGEAKEN